MRISSESPQIREFLLGQSEWIRTREGFEMKVNSQYDHTSFLLRLFGDLEPKTKRFILGNMEDGEAFLDVGANVGYFGLLVAARFPRARVVAFEPNPPISHCLAESVQRNKFEHRMKVVGNAVSNKEGELSFVVETQNSGHSRIDTGSSSGEVIKVQSVVFDEWVRTNPLECRIGCMKMDVEGAEFLALQGMRAMLEQDRPALCIEGYDNQLQEFGSSLAGLRLFLTDAGYREVEAFDGNLFLKHQSRMDTDES